MALTLADQQRELLQDRFLDINKLYYYWDSHPITLRISIDHWEQIVRQDYQIYYDWHAKNANIRATNSRSNKDSVLICFENHQSAVLWKLRWYNDE